MHVTIIAQHDYLFVHTTKQINQLCILVSEVHLLSKPIDSSDKSCISKYVNTLEWLVDGLQPICLFNNPVMHSNFRCNIGFHTVRGHALHSSW